MSVLQSIFLGIVQGITEFLPVSSSGHLAILENIFHIDTDGGMLFDIMLHVGTLAAVFVVYHKDIWRMIVETFKMIGDLFANLHIYMLNRIHKTSLKYHRVVHNNYRKFVMLVLRINDSDRTDRYHWKGACLCSRTDAPDPRDLSSDDRRAAAHCGYDQGRT